MSIYILRTGVSPSSSPHRYTQNTHTVYIHTTVYTLYIIYYINTFVLCIYSIPSPYIAHTYINYILCLQLGYLCICVLSVYNYILYTLYIVRVYIVRVSIHLFTIFASLWVSSFVLYGAVLRILQHLMTTPCHVIWLSPTTPCHLVEPNNTLS